MPSQPETEDSRSEVAQPRPNKHGMLWLVPVAVVTALLLIYLLAGKSWLPIALLILATCGAVFRKPRFIVAAGVGLAAAVVTSVAAWIQFGDTHTMQWARGAMSMCANLSQKLESWHSDHGDYPGTLDVLDAEGLHPDSRFSADGGRLIHEYYGVFTYQRTSDGYDLTWLGTDNAAGGDGIHADRIFDQKSHRLTSVSVPFAQFLLETPGSPGAWLAVVVATIIATVVSLQDDFVSVRSERRVRWMAVMGIVSVTAVICVFLAGFHIQASQSSH